jgi:hypothetical protein
VVNWSFEMADEVNLVTCHGGLGEAPNEGVWGWTGGAWPGSANPTWSGVDVNCGWDLACADCRDWHVFPDGNVVAYFDMGTFGYQLTDQNITPGHMYTLTSDLMTWWTPEGHVQPIRLQFYYLDDPCEPDVNHVVVADKVYMIEGYELESCAGKPDCLDDWQYDKTLQWVAQAGQAYENEKLGIRIGSPTATEYTGSSWAWADRVRLNWKWASSAYDPDPEHEEANVSKNPTLCWTPGLWTATSLGHQVYFGTDEAAVTDANTNSPEYMQVQTPNCYTPSGPLELGKMYYWRVDEVNDDYVGPLPPPWKGDTWSFEIEGYATDPSPYDGESDVPYLDQLLMWTAGTEATSHDVYFGTDEEAVADANTNSSEFKGNQALGDTDWPLPALDVDTTYFWRIDEQSAVHPNGLPGKVWSFMTGEFLILDDFDQYTNVDPCMYEVWDDYYVNNSDAIISLQTGDMNYIAGGEGKSMQVEIDNTSKDGAAFRGSYVDCQDLTELEAGGDWTIGGVKALTMYLIGDPCNRPHVGVDAKTGPYIEKIAPWVEVEDTSSNVSFVAYDSPSNMLYDYQWFEWNIDVNIFDACGVTLSAIDRLTIGFGGDKVGQKATPTKNTKGYVHIDDLRLYPARCITKFAQVAGNITEEDCTIDNFDMQIMADDWLIADGCFPTSTADANITMKEGDPNWCTGHFNNALGFDPNIEVDVCNPGLMGLSNMSITAWVYREGEPLESYIGIVTCREKQVEDSTELACGSSKKSPTVGYCWNQITATWQFSSGIPIPDGEWMFMAMAVDPTGCTLWGAPAGGTLVNSRHSIVLGPLEQFDHRFWIGRGRADSRYFTGKIDDVRIFADTLDGYEMQWLFTDGVDGNDPCCPAYHYTFDESSGLTGADDGCGAIVYRPPMSPANLIDPEPKMERLVNFRDFDVMATNWLQEYLWPEW